MFVTVSPFDVNEIKVGVQVKLNAVGVSGQLKKGAFWLKNPG